MRSRPLVLFGGVLAAPSPGLGAPRSRPPAPAWDALAAKVAAGGIRFVRGNLVADDTWFDSLRLAPGWAWDDEPFSYNAQISALTAAPDTDFDAGSIIVKVSPGTAGGPAK